MRVGLGKPSRYFALPLRPTRKIDASREPPQTQQTRDSRYSQINASTGTRLEVPPSCRAWKCSQFPKSSRQGKVESMKRKAYKKPRRKTRNRAVRRKIKSRRERVPTTARQYFSR